ncbi:TIR domain-containing protein [Candidatus Deianiraea vastatrix]|uniref:TIR domain protein n=1 Tax=Candidatus Deianiraea vastatrix TaxID=2163644 RepID=A0A5B8XCJ0_9RICK|nr:TIR domain-containing protein [Candidatus Deianiraea vastatrix]QED23069.1 Putative TIR domain protein [Candidatus Deianiraea vastatrix]
MSVFDKINRVNNIIAELDKLGYNYETQEYILKYYNIEFLNHYNSYGDDYGLDLYKSILNADEKTILAIENDLNNNFGLIKDYPKHWIDNNNLKCFISHHNKFAPKAHVLREALLPYKISCFVAHDDIETSLPWAKEIKKALSTMDMFISLHTDITVAQDNKGNDIIIHGCKAIKGDRCKKYEGFNLSNWCQQEIGFAIARNVHIFPINLDRKSNPTGFLSEIQATKPKKIEDMTKEIIANIRSSKIAKLYNNINPEIITNTDDDIPF